MTFPTAPANATGPASAPQADAAVPPEASDPALEQRAQQLVEEKEREARLRDPGGKLGKAVTVVAVVWSLFQLLVGSVWTLDALTLRSVHIMFMMVLAFTLYPLRRGQTRPGILDWLLLAAGLGAFAYQVAEYSAITLRGGYYLPMDQLVAGVGVLICFEMARRTVGNLAWLAGLFFAYNFFGAFIPGPFGHAGFSWNRVVEHMFWGSQGLLGVGVGVSASYIFLFILFGVFLKVSGFSAFINDLALTLVGRTAGGPAKVAVIASALMGMINGSALANVATTGAITIPLMKRTGYKADFAAAVEAVASTGGQFAPPIMGAVGFLMAEFLGIPYTTVMLAAIIPASLYYLALIMAVHFEARKLGLKGLSAEQIPAALDVLRLRGHLAAPLIVLLVVLGLGYTPLYAATLAILATVVTSWWLVAGLTVLAALCEPSLTVLLALPATLLAAFLLPQRRMSLRALLASLDEGARAAVGVGAACVIIGIIVGTVSLTSLGLTFGYEVLKYVHDGQLYLGGLFVMIMSVILGMGVPGVAAYVIVATVAAPVLVKVGASPLAAHMFCLIYACLSNITPPVAMSSYVAAGIARSNQTRTSFIAMRLGMAGFILPFFFLGNPLLLYGTGQSIPLACWAFISAGLGVTALAAGLEGWLLGPCSLAVRGLLLVTSLLAIDPNLYTDLAGFVCFALALFLSRRAASGTTSGAAAAPVTRSQAAPVSESAPK